MRRPLEIISDDIIQQYNLKELSGNGLVYNENLRAMYGLKQAEKIAYDELVKYLKPFGYSFAKHTPGYWRHKTKPISFVLYVDDFAIKYTNENDLNHLLQALKTKYTITTDLTCRLYCVISLNWNYDKNYVNLSMPGYVQSTLHKFQHHPPRRRYYATYPWIKPTYGQKQQFLDTIQSPPLYKTETTRIQAIIGTFLYYARAIDDKCFSRSEFNWYSTVSTNT